MFTHDRVPRYLPTDASSCQRELVAQAGDEVIHRIHNGAHSVLIDEEMTVLVDDTVQSLGGKWQLEAVAFAKNHPHDQRKATQLKHPFTRFALNRKFFANGAPDNQTNIQFTTSPLHRDSAPTSERCLGFSLLQQNCTISYESAPNNPVNIHGTESLTDIVVALVCSKSIIFEHQS